MRTSSSIAEASPAYTDVDEKRNWPLPSATVDVWEDDTRVARWSARALMPAVQEAERGRLSGRTKDGLQISGDVEVANRQMGPGGPRGQTLVELHGSGPLEGLEGPPAG